MPKVPRTSASPRASPYPVNNPSEPTPTLRSAAGAWTPHDDEILMTARAQGMNWGPIQQQNFPSKTPNACRKRHERLMERRCAEDWDGGKLEKLAIEYMALRKDMWSMLAAKVGEKWQIIEQKCMEKGLKNLQSAGRNAQRREKMLLTSVMDDETADESRARGALIDSSPLGDISTLVNSSPPENKSIPANSSPLGDKR